MISHRISSNRRRRGFSMIEIMMALSLLFFVTLMGGELFRSTLTLCYDDRNYQNRNSSVDSVIDQLRHSVWRSTAITVTNPSTALLTFPDKTTEIWQIAADGSISRERDSSVKSSFQMRWESIANSWSFKQDDVSLTVADTNPKSGGQVRLISQLLLARVHP